MARFGGGVLQYSHVAWSSESADSDWVQFQRKVFIPTRYFFILASLNNFFTDSSWSAIIYPESESQRSGRTGEAKSLNGQHEVFNSISNTVKRRIKQMVSSAKEQLTKSDNELASGSVGGFSSLMAGAIAIALCRIRATKNQVTDSRICLLTAGKENPTFYTAQYMNFMNVFFSAQKLVRLIRLKLIPLHLRSWLNFITFHSD